MIVVAVERWWWSGGMVSIPMFTSSAALFVMV